MLSIIDLLDFMDLDRETVQIVNDATRVSDTEAAEMARGLLRQGNRTDLAYRTAKRRSSS